MFATYKGYTIKQHYNSYDIIHAGVTIYNKDTQQGAIEVIDALLRV